MTGDGQLTRQNIFSRGDATSRDCSSFCCFLLQHRVKGGRPTQHSVAEPVRVRTSDPDPSSASSSTSLSRPKCYTWPPRVTCDTPALA